MEDKTFDLIEKMYADLKNEIKLVKTDLNSEIQLVRTGLATEIQSVRTDLTTEIQSVGNHVSKVELIIENEIKPDIKLSLQGYHDLSEKLTTLEEKFDDLAEKVEYHGVEIAALKSGR